MLRPALRAAMLAANAAAFIPPYLLLRALRGSGPSPVRRAFHGQVCRSLGLRVTVEGTASRPPTLYLSNHLSWSDIPVLGSTLDASFIAKAEVAGWPVVRRLAALQDTVYVERQRRRSMLAERDALAARLRAGDSLVLFAEATTSDGTHLREFRSSMLAVLDAPGMENVSVCPVTLAYTAVDGLAVTRQLLPAVAWFGDVPLARHVLGLMRLRGVQARVALHAPLRRRDFPSRKALASHCRAVVEAGYIQLMRGQTEGFDGARSSTMLPPRTGATR